MESTQTDGWVAINIILLCAKMNAKNCLDSLEVDVTAPFSFGLMNAYGKKLQWGRCGALDEGRCKFIIFVFACCTPRIKVPG